MAILWYLRAANAHLGKSANIVNSHVLVTLGRQYQSGQGSEHEGASLHLGSGANFVNSDVFVTSDFKYHEFFDADGRIVIADVGHYESEWQTTDLILKRLNEKFPNFALHLAKANQNPIHYR